MVMRNVNLGLHSWHDFTSTAARRLSEPALPGASTESVTGNQEFTGTRNFEQAVKMAKSGWQDGAKRIAKTLDSLPPDFEVLPDWSMDVTGVICNVSAFTAGEPECMWRMSECKKSERRIALIVPAAYHSGIAATVAMNYAIGVAAVVRSLEASGINPAVYSISSHSWRALATYGIVVREFGEPLDLSKVAFAFHPSFLRRLVFGWLELNPAAVEAGIASEGYGQPCEVTAEQVREIAGTDIGNIVQLPSLAQVTPHTPDHAIKLLSAHVSQAIKQML